MAVLARRAQACRGDVARRRCLHLAHGRHGSDVLLGGAARLAGLLGIAAAGVRVCEVDVGGRLGVVALGLDQARLEVDNVFAEGVVLSLDGLEVVFEGVEFADLLLELLDVSFFPLAKGTLRTRGRVSNDVLSPTKQINKRRRDIK